jgi:hypothetical protein
VDHLKDGAPLLPGYASESVVAGRVRRLIQWFPWADAAEFDALAGLGEACIPG